MADNRADIAIDTLAALSDLIVDEHANAPENFKPGLVRAQSILTTLTKALRLQQGPKRGQPRGQRAGP